MTLKNNQSSTALDLYRKGKEDCSIKLSPVSRRLNFVHEDKYNLLTKGRPSQKVTLPDMHKTHFALFNKDLESTMNVHNLPKASEGASLMRLPSFLF